jgi:hypothetical protein
MNVSYNTSVVKTLAKIRSLVRFLKKNIYANNPSSGHWIQGCQMVSFQTKNPNLGKFWRAVHGKMLIYFMAIWNILQTCWDIL